MNNTILFFLKGIIIVALSKKLGQYASKKSLINRILMETQMPFLTMEEENEGTVVTSLKETLEWLYSLPEEENIPTTEIVLTLKVNLGPAFDHYLDAVKSALELKTEEEQAQALAYAINEVKRLFLNQDFSKAVNDARRSLGRSTTESKKEIIQQLKTQVDRVEEEYNLTNTKSLLGSGVDGDDISAMVEVVNTVKEQLSTEGLIKTGYKGINEATGYNGIPRGSFVNITGLTNNYKTGLLIDIFRQLCMYNKPYLFDKTKKPLIVRISFENQLSQDIPKLYEDLKANVDNEAVDILETDSNEAAKYIKEKLSSSGYSFKMVAIDPSSYTPNDLINYLQSLIDEGYEVHAAIIDYIEIIAKNDRTVREDMAVTNAIESIRTFCFPRGITIFNGHQYNTISKTIKAENGSYQFLQRVRDGGYHMNCRALDTKVDLEIGIDIYKNEDTSWLLFAIGKSRFKATVPHRRKTFLYRFQKFGALRDDFECSSPKCVYDYYSISSGMDSDIEQPQTPIKQEAKEEDDNETIDL